MRSIFLAYLSKIQNYLDSGDDKIIIDFGYSPKKGETISSCKFLYEETYELTIRFKNNDNIPIETNFTIEIEDDTNAKPHYYLITIFSIILLLTYILKNKKIK